MGIVARQGISNSISLLIGFAIGAVNTIVLVPKAFPGDALEHWGIGQLLLSWSVIFSVLLSFSSGSIAVRFLPKYSSQNRSTEIFWFVWMIPLIGWLILSLLVLLFHKPFFNLIMEKEGPDTFLLGLFLIGITGSMTFMRTISGIALHKLKTGGIAFFNEVYVRLFYTAAIVLYAMDMINLTGLISLFLLGHLSQTIFAHLFFSRDSSFTFSSKPSSLKELMGFGFYGVLDNGASILVSRMDVIMIGAMVGLKEIQYYNIAFFMMAVMALPGRALSNVSSSLIAKAFHENDNKKIQDLYEKNSLNQFLFGGFIFVGIWVCIDQVFLLLPPEYAVGKWAFFFLSVSKIFDLITSINGAIILTSDKFRYNFIFNAILLVLTFLTNYLLLPHYGVVGAAIATAISILLFNLMKGLAIFFWFGFNPFHPNTLLAIFSLALSFLAGWIIPENDMSPIWLILMKGGVTTTTFLVSVLILNVSDDFTKLMKGFFPSRR